MEQVQKVVFRKKAAESIAAIAHHISEAGYPETANKFAAKLHAFGRSLASFPDKYKACEQPRLAQKNYRCAVFQKNYTFVYRLENDTLMIYNVIHARTNPKSFAA